MEGKAILTVVDGLFRFNSGRFNNIPVVADLKDDLEERGPFQVLVVDVKVGREMSILMFKEKTLHGPVAIRRYPALNNTDRGEVFSTVINAIVSTVVLCLKTVPQQMMVKTFIRESDEETEWELAGDDRLGEAIMKGLLSSKSTFIFGAQEFSVFCDDAVYKGWHFKPPRYYNNIFLVPQWSKRGPKW